jgi:hypothetical protein
MKDIPEEIVKLKSLLDSLEAFIIENSDDFTTYEANAFRSVMNNILSIQNVKIEEIRNKMKK